MTRVLITGTSRGIGRATAIACATRGTELGLLGRPSKEQRETTDLCLKNGARRVLELACDVSVATEVEKAAGEFLRSCGPPDALIHNAGVAARTSIEDTTLSSWEDHLRVNLTAPYVLTRALLPAMRVRRTGRIVFVGSISATLGTAKLAAYCASKWGIVGFMKSLAQELADSGLMTCAVLPGSVDTRMLAGSGFPARMTPEDVARTLLHYALEAPLAHNGASIEMFGV
jgi:3-oxoacyl-[acyl-carrier protein] reductase